MPPLTSRTPSGAEVNVVILACIVFLAGVLTIVSPCILPVLPFVFTRADRKFSTNGLPMLIGMAITFAGVATLAAVGGAWVVRFNQFGRALALVLLAAFAATLLSRRLADALARPFVALGNLLIQSEGAASGRDGIVTSLLLGVATGLLWAPCAGPILGLLLTGAALSGPTPRTTLLLVRLRRGRGHLARRGDTGRRPPRRRTEALARRR